MDGISPESLLQSLNVDSNRDAIFKSGEGAGQSGSFFFFSYDKKFLVKTVHHSEMLMMLKMSKSYLDHLKETKGRSLLGRIYGLFTLRTKNFVPVDFVIMQNTSMLY